MSSGGGGDALWPKLTAHDLEALRAAASALRGPVSRISWYPDYGCALLTAGQWEEEGDIGPRPGELPLLLIGLDEWAFRVHR